MIVISPNELESFEIPKQESKETQTYYLYFLWYDDVLVYIGQTVSLPGRIVNHKLDKHFNKVTYKVFEHTTKQEILKIESLNIKHFNPPYNNNTTGIAKTPNLALVRSGKVYEKHKLYSSERDAYYYDGIVLQKMYTYCLYNNSRLSTISYYEDDVLIKEFKRINTEEVEIEFSILNHKIVHKTIKKQIDFIFKRGKYIGVPYLKVCKKDKSYIDWMIKNIPDYKTSMLRPH
jgi:hypothetical protein